MTTLSEIVNKEVKLKTLLSEPLKELVATSGFKLQIVNDEQQDLLEEMDLLIEETFPEKEAEEYKPSQILYSEDNTLCIACLKNGIVQGCITVNVDLEENTVTLISLAVDKKYRNQKMGSMLMLALHDVCCELSITSISLISSNAGKVFYESFGFKPMAHNSYEATLPFAQSIITKKVSFTPEKLTPPVPKNNKRSNKYLINSSIFKPTDAPKSTMQEEARDNGVDERNNMRPIKRLKSLKPTLEAPTQSEQQVSHLNTL
ncbi:GNAT family N-acetyltransferase [Legionella fallonii]|uniref:N-acetyltransferase domain-containing protein n=1 Tax=Legionella fallonii LLAP-10 TaxID=1212491 RepID=A0A098G0T1_9GAMM|nr:GNAT family N-acetyltransferase [Legionella fallonii]CEG56122.1 protein of unknown function [Legionella fallonii LLAP-10]